MLKKLVQRGAAMTNGELLLWREFGEGALKRRIEEERIVSEATFPLGCEKNSAVGGASRCK